ncbi:MAG: DUF2062 domain-containing protein [Geminicoccaceae bacterium]|nr:DUF2062 domain-containing protein [Geminicoccaceae bacterium]
MKFKILRPMLRAWRSKSYRQGTLGLSLAAGMVIGFSPTVGLQVVICLVAGFLWNKFSTIHLSLPAMLVGSMVVNPLTMGPTYFVYYKIGCVALACDVAMSADAFASFSSITEMGETILAAVSLGSVPFMLAGIPLGIFLGNRIEAFLHRRRARRQERGGRHKMNFLVTDK